MEERPLCKLRAGAVVPRSMWRRFQRPRSSRSDDEDARIAAACNGVMGTKRRPHDEDHQQQQAQGAKKEKTTRLLTTTNDDGMMLPSFLTEYTTEDMARFNQDMAHNDKLIDEAAAKLAEGVAVAVVPDDILPSPSLLELLEEEERRNEEGGHRTLPGRVSDATVKMLRAFTTTRFHPISERFLRDPSLFDEDVADDIREGDRFISKVYAWAQERAAEAVEEYDAKGYLHCNADGTIKLSKPSAPN